MIRLSFIVPFYNVEKYIEECIRSLYDQDIPQEEYEVLCVDDCSPDGSRAIVEQLQKEYPTLRLLTHSENKRQGGARNTGLREAKGEYVWFVDSDDYIMPNCMKSLSDHAEKENLEILQFDYTKGNRPMLLQVVSDEIMQGEEYLFGDGASLWYDKVIGPWRQIFKRQFLVDKRLQFVEGVQYEDTDYLLRAFLAARRVQYVPIIGYEYRVNEESVTVAPLSPLKLAWRINLIVRCQQCVEVAKTDIGKDTISKMVADSMSSVRKEVKKLSYKQRKDYICRLTPQLRSCRLLVSWRTWLAIRYGITWFI